MRARSLKPALFKNESLAELDPMARILFPGLWCLADREGRLEDRPKRIKAEVFPYDDCDIEPLLEALSKHGFIIRYEVESSRFIQVVNFSKHQNPHKKEKQSEIPPYLSPEQTRNKPGASTGQGTYEHQTSPADSPFIDSPFIDPCNPIPSNNGLGSVFEKWQEFNTTPTEQEFGTLRTMHTWITQEFAKHGINNNPSECLCLSIQDVINTEPPPDKPLGYLRGIVRNQMEKVREQNGLE